jgi:hypothetical protein
MDQDVASEFEYCPGCKCMIDQWWNYCAICGFHTATNDEQRNETAAQRVAEEPKPVSKPGRNAPKRKARRKAA